MFHKFFICLVPIIFILCSYWPIFSKFLQEAPSCCRCFLYKYISIFSILNANITKSTASSKLIINLVIFGSVIVISLLFYLIYKKWNNRPRLISHFHIWYKILPSQSHQDFYFCNCYFFHHSLLIPIAFYRIYSFIST